MDQIVRDEWLSEDGFQSTGTRIRKDRGFCQRRRADTRREAGQFRRLDKQIGASNDIEHETLESLEGEAYGLVVQVLKRQRRDG